MTWKRIAVLLVVGLVGVGILLVLLAEFHEEIADPFSMNLDLHIQSVVHGYTSPGMTRMMVDLSAMGSPGFLFPFSALLAALFLLQRRFRDAGVFVTAMVGARILIGVLKLYFHRARPDVPWALAAENSFAFPSGHSIVAVVLYGTLLYLRVTQLRRTWQRVAVSAVVAGLILGVGLSRIYLGVHYPSDVVAGYLVGCSWLATVMLAEWGVRRMERTA